MEKEPGLSTKGEAIFEKRSMYLLHFCDLGVLFLFVFFFFSSSFPCETYESCEFFPSTLYCQRKIVNMSPAQEHVL